MRRKSHIILVVSLGLFSLASAADEFGSERASVVAAAEQGFADAFAARDLEAFAGFIHPEAVFAGRDGPLVGKDAILAVWGEYFEPEAPPFSWAPERVLVSPDGTIAATTGPVRNPAGEWVGSFSSTWARQPDGSWQVVFDMSPRCPPRVPESGAD